MTIKEENSIPLMQKGMSLINDRYNFANSLLNSNKDMRCVLFKNIFSSNTMIKGSVLKTFDETYDGLR